MSGFIVLGVIVVVGIVYWVMKHKATTKFEADRLKADAAAEIAKVTGSKPTPTSNTVSQ
jgi:flagellar basal body-associated protein FliL